MRIALLGDMVLFGKCSLASKFGARSHLKGAAECVRAFGVVVSLMQAEMKR